MSDSVAFMESVKQTAALRIVGADPSLIDFEARWVVSEFLSETRVWTRVVNVPITGGISDYALPIEDEQSVVVLMGVRSSAGDVPVGDVPALLDPNVTGAPRCVGMLDDRVVRVFPIPSDAESSLVLSVHVALTLLTTLDVPPPDALRPYHHHLLDGLLARLYGIPDKPWTNSRFAGTHLQRFQSGKTFVRREVVASRTFGSRRMRIPTFGA